MTKKHNQQVIILSAELSDLSNEENKSRTLTLDSWLRDLGLNFTQVQGCYKGSSEESFLVVIRESDCIETLKGFAFKQFNQDSVLYQDTSGLCYLEYENGISNKIGRFEQVNPNYIKTLDAYTVINDKVFTIK